MEDEFVVAADDRKTAQWVNDGKLSPLLTPRSILFIAPQPFFAVRGSSFRIRATVEALAASGYPVDLLTYGLGQEIEVPGVRLLRAGRFPGIRKVPIGPSWAKFLMDISLALETLRLCLKKRYSVIHGVEEGGVIAALSSLLAGVPFVFDMHSCMSEQIRDTGRWNSRFFAAFVSAVESVCVKRAAAVMTVGSAHAARIQAASMTEAFAVEDTAPEAEQEPNPEHVRNLEQQFNPEKSKIILYAGNFALYQGLDLLLRAFTRLKLKQLTNGERKNAKLMVVGGEMESRSGEKLRTLASEAGLDGDVLFIGQRPPEEMADFLALADVLVSPRISGKNTPLKIYSFMAAKKPIVATNIASHTQVLDESCAYLCDAEPEALACGMMEALDDSAPAVEKRRMRAERAAEYFMDRYTSQCFQQKVARLYAAVFGQERQDPAAPQESAPDLPQSTQIIRDQ